MLAAAAELKFELAGRLRDALDPTSAAGGRA
ncbi:hypothetical protein [Microbacterium sp. K36]